MRSWRPFERHMPEPRSRVAAFLDRDGTIIEDRDYTNDPGDVVLLPHAADGIRALAAAGYHVIVVTNQSGIARGLVSLGQYHAVRQRLDELLRESGAELADTMTCPHHPEFTGPCACRKPELGLYERAAAVWDLDLSRCLFIGDRMRDVIPAAAFGARAVLVRSPATESPALHESGIPAADTLAEAARLVLANVT